MRIVTRHRMTGSGAVLAAILLAVGMSSPSRAAVVTTITYEFGGTIDAVDPALSGAFAIGQSISGSYTFDPSIAARAGSTSTFAIFDALTNLNFFSIGSYTASSTGAPEIQVDNDPPGSDGDRYAVVSRASDGLTGPDVNGNSLAAFGFRLDDSTETVFSDALVLPTSLNLADFDSAQFFLFFDSGGGTADTPILSGTITSLRVQAVPEPSTAILAGLGGLGGLVVLRARRKRRVA